MDIKTHINAKIFSFSGEFHGALFYNTPLMRANIFYNSKYASTNLLESNNFLTLS